MTTDLLGAQNSAQHIVSTKQVLVFKIHIFIDMSENILSKFIHYLKYVFISSDNRPSFLLTLIDDLIHSGTIADNPQI